MEAGSDTTTSTLLSFILAGLKHPHVFKKGQEEIDAVCGVDRSPAPDDIRKFPYLEACMNEVSVFVNALFLVIQGCYSNCSMMADSPLASSGSWRHPSYAYRR